MLNWPLAFVTVVRATEVLFCVTVTFALAMRAPEGSITVPPIATLPPPCARAQAPDTVITSKASIRMRHIVVIPPGNDLCLIGSPSADPRLARILHTTCPPPHCISPEKSCLLSGRAAGQGESYAPVSFCSRHKLSFSKLSWYPPARNRILRRFFPRPVKNRRRSLYL